MGERTYEGAYRLDGPPTLPGEVLGRPITVTVTIDVRYMREHEAHTAKRPSLSRIFGLAPASLPVIFSRWWFFQHSRAVDL